MLNATPILVGRNAPEQEVATPAVAQAPVAANPLQEQLLAAQVAPAPTAEVAPVATVAPVTQQAVVQQTGGCMMYFNIKPVTKLELEMPWGFISEAFDTAFISSVGELVVSELPPMYDKTHDVFVLSPDNKSLVLGRVSEEYVQYWRDSVSFRPDSGYTEEDVQEFKVEDTQTEVVQETIKEPELEDTTNYAHLSRNQRKKIKNRRLRAGENLEDLPKELRDA